MKKRDEGYVLAFVLVVIVVICLISVSMMTASLQNLKSQTASVERMEQKYKAQGEMEKVVNTIDWDGWLSGMPAESNVETVLEDYFKPLDAGQAPTVNVTTADEGAGLEKDLKVLLDIQVSPEGDPYKVNATLEWTANLSAALTISNEKLVYTAYEVTAVEPTPVSEEVGG